MSVRSEPRTTRDVDIAVAVSDDREAESILRDLVSRGYRSLGGVEQTDTGRLATMRLVPPDSGPLGAIVDLCSRPRELNRTSARARTRWRWLMGSLRRSPVATVGHLVAMKLLSRDDDHRPQGIIDLHAWIGVASDADLEVAASAVQGSGDRKPCLCTGS